MNRLFMCHRTKRIGNLPHNKIEVHLINRLAMLAHLDARQRKKIIYQAGHAPRLRMHDLKETFESGNIAFRRPL